MFDKKILITGATGQLGTEVSQLLPNAIKTNSKDLDITNQEQVNDFINDNKIDKIINCAAYTATDKAEDDEEQAYKVNALGPQNLANTGCKIIHISTDYVFNGFRYRPYSPTSTPDPLSVYGKTKLQGENFVLQYATNPIIIRTSWLYSAHGNNFLKTMLRLGAERKNLNVVSDQIGSPTYAKDLAQAIVAILPHINEKTNGVYHYSNEGVCSWYDFATAIMQLYNLDCKVNPIFSSEYPTKAKRPLYSVLDKTKIKQTFGLEIPHWIDALKRCLNEIQR